MRPELAQFELNLSLPKESEWGWASYEGDSRVLTFGDDYDQRWVKSRYARLAVEPEPLLGFPIDESPLGIYDLAGSGREWCSDAEPGSGGARRMLGGGSWLDAEMGDFKIKRRESASVGTRDSSAVSRMVARMVSRMVSRMVACMVARRRAEQVTGEVGQEKSE